MSRLTPLPESNHRGPAARRAYIDWARAVAVLVMIEAHTLDSWTRAADRHTHLFRNLTVLGGFAAPFFLWLAGLGVVLSATRKAERDGDRLAAVETICRRGLEIFLLAFLFRIQAFVVSPGGHLVHIFRVDILNVMGLAIVAAGLVWGLTASTRRLALAFASAAAAIAMLTPIVRASPLVDLLPLWLQWYIRPFGDYTVFTLFPWAGFVFAGGACGALMASARGADEERRLHTWIVVAGAGIVAAGFYTSTLPRIYRQSSFWTTSPTFFAIRVGVLMIAFTAIFSAARLLERRGIALRPLAKLGQSSLFVYWIHVELVYGYASWLWRGKLPLWGTAIAYVAFCVLMYRAILWRDRWVERRGSGRSLHYKELSMQSAP
jgi:uncharacterized membrane protein